MKKRLLALLLTVFVLTTMTVSSFASFTLPEENEGDINCDHFIGFGSFLCDEGQYQWEYCVHCDYIANIYCNPHMYLEGDECYDCGYKCTHSVKTSGTCNYCGWQDPAIQEAYQNGYNAGYSAGENDGVNVGYSSGYADGKTEGIAEGRENGYNSGYAEGLAQGYKEGLQGGKQEGYQSGYNDGKTEGVAEGRENGYNSGYAEGLAQGYKEGLQGGKQEGYQSGYNDGKNEGYQNGYNDGRIQGQEDEVSNMLPNMFDGLFDSVGAFTNTFLDLGIGSITIGALVGLALTVLLVLLVVKIIRG